LIADPLEETGIALLREVAEVTVRPKLSEEELAQLIGDYDALIVRSGTKVTRRVIERAARLKVIGRAGIGVDNIDVDAATDLPVGDQLYACFYLLADDGLGHFVIHACQFGVAQLAIFPSGDGATQALVGFRNFRVVVHDGDDHRRLPPCRVYCHANFVADLGGVSR